MLTRPFRAIVLAAFVFAPVVAFRQAASVSAQVPTAADAPKYVLPPQAIVDVFDAEFLPQTIVSPNHQIVALTRARAYPTIAELAQPMLRLAGSRVNPKTNGPHRASGLPGTGIYAIALKKIDARTFEAQNKSDGKPTVTTRVTVAADGKTITATQSGANLQGQAIKNSLLFEKQ